MISSKLEFPLCLTTLPGFLRCKLWKKLQRGNNDQKEPRDRCELLSGNLLFLSLFYVKKKIMIIIHKLSWSQR